MKWTEAAWDLFESVLFNLGYCVEHCVHCSGRVGRGAEWGVPDHPHPTCLILAFRKDAHGLSRVSFDPEHYTGC